MKQFHLVIACFLAMLLISANVLRADEAITIEQIKKAWDERSSKVKSVNAKWEVKIFVPAGGESENQQKLDSLRGMHSKAMAQRNKGENTFQKQTGTIPEHNYEATTKSRFAINDYGCLFERDRPQ